MEGHIQVFSNVHVKKGGFHHIPEGLTQSGNCRIVQIIDEPDELGYYTAHIDFKEVKGDGTVVWHKKHYPTRHTGGVEVYIPNKMFPSHWTKEELFENIAFAYMNRTFKKDNLYHGFMPDGRKIAIAIDSPTDFRTVYWVKEEN